MNPSRVVRPRPPYLRLVTPLPIEPARFIEISIAWGDNPIRVVHLETPTTFTLDEAVGSSFVAPVRGGPIVIDRDGFPFARVTDGARNIRLNDRRTDKTLIPLHRNTRCQFEIGALAISIAAIDLPPPPATPKWWRLQWALLILSLALNAAVIALLMRG
jgi:hypothetical protein